MENKMDEIYERTPKGPLPQKILEENKQWLDSTWEKVDNKLSRVAVECRQKLPYTTVDGRYNDLSEKTVYGWTNGFWPGLMWLMYIETKNPTYRETAEIAENTLDRAFTTEFYECLNHDVGFSWDLSSGVQYRLLKAVKSKIRLMMAAGVLASRYNPNGGFIRAWNGEGKEGYTIIDCMMNLPLLYRATEVSGDPRYGAIAMKHADLTMKDHLRPDGSVYHVANHDPKTGELLGYPESQGYDAQMSSWSRGQGWALYGFVLSYIHTGKQCYLDTAKKIAHYFIAALPEDYVPRCDFRAPEEPVYYDASAGLIAACGLIELAKYTQEYEKELYLRPAIGILKAVEENHCDFTDKDQAIVQHSTEAYHSGKKNISMVYADYYFVEALYKLRGNSFLFW